MNTTAEQFTQEHYRGPRTYINMETHESHIECYSGVCGVCQSPEPQFQHVRRVDDEWQVDAQWCAECFTAVRVQWEPAA